MKKTAILFAFLLGIIHCLEAQISFEKGYFIKNSGEKVSCLIRNADWNNNPNSFKYKQSEDGEVSTGTIEEVKEFGVGNTAYRRATVKIDRSIDKFDGIDDVRNPIFSKETLFLKVLIDGKADLFVYHDNPLEYFFYQKEGEEAKPLVYKKYKSNGYIRYNTFFRQELLTAYKDQGIELKDVEKLEYTSSALQKFFIMLNQKLDPSYVDSTTEKPTEIDKTKKTINFYARPGLTASALSIERDAGSDYWDNEFDRKLGFRAGVEAEFVLNFNKNKWAVIVEPTYQTYSAEAMQEAENVVGGQFIATVKYSSIELPIGIRHFFYLGDASSKLFVNASLVLDMAVGSEMEFLRGDRSRINSLDEIRSGPNFAFGVGYNYSNKITAEVRYTTPRNLLGTYNGWTSNYNTLSVVLGYKVF